MSSELRRRIMYRVGDYLPSADPFKVKRHVSKIFLKYTADFERLAVKEIIPTQFLGETTPIIPGYETNEFLKHFSSLSFIVPTIYLPSIPEQTTKSGWAESGWRNTDLSIIDIRLGRSLYLPHVHECSPYDDHLRTHRNNFTPSGEVLELLEKFAIETNTYIEPLQKFSLLHHQLRELLNKFHTTKQLTDAWPEIESFIPSEYLADSIRQKKAKKVPLTLEELKQINAISKELLIQKMLKG